MAWNSGHDVCIGMKRCGDGCCIRSLTQIRVSFVNKIVHERTQTMKKGRL